MQRFDNFSTYLRMREEFPVFTYESYHYEFSGETLALKFTFNLSGKYFFHPLVVIPVKNFFRPQNAFKAGELDALVFHAGMIELISYWKAACPATVIIKPHSLTGEQAAFWKKLYYHGLGEFFYINSITEDQESFMNFHSTGPDPLQPFAYSGIGRMVPVGGGKDSAVTIGLMEKAGLDWLPFALSPVSATGEVIRTTGKTRNDTLVFERIIDPMLIELNNRGFLNGHTPFSALLAFYSLLAAYLTGKKDIVLSNESSANEPTVPGTEINHQYSKSFGFEKDFREYVLKNISSGFNYFSLLRPLSELQIARLFSGMPKFFPHFKSCNAGSKAGIWCGRCPKCLFTFIILSPFLEPGELTRIFGKNLLNDASLAGYLDELTGESPVKPFECIGTVDEVNTALAMTVKHYEPEAMPYLLGISSGRINKADSDLFVDIEKQKMLKDEHFVPVEYSNLLEEVLR